jgi:ComF family protein
MLIGYEFGQKLLHVEHLFNLSGILAVPLHPKKERLRGYNQSQMFAEGLSRALEIPVMSHLLVRELHRVSQTRKKRLERYENVSENFVIRDTRKASGKHFLLVDDVLTTGATLEMCGRTLLDVPGTELSIATIAIAQH